MGLLDKAMSFLRREAKDVADMADKAKAKLDTELSKRETKLKMSPSEKIDALNQEAASTDEKFDKIIDKAESRAAGARAEAEVADLADAVSSDGADDRIADAIQSDASTDASASGTASAGTEGETAGSVAHQTPSTSGTTETSIDDAKYGKTPAQIKYEQARAAADDLLDELRGELKDDGTV